MSQFTDLAKKKTSNSFVSEGRQKITLDDLILEYPDGVTVMAVDEWQGDTDPYIAFNIKEDFNIYSTGGKALYEIASAWYSDMGYDSYEELSKDLAKSGGVKMRFEKTRTKTGRKFTKIDILD